MWHLKKNVKKSSTFRKVLHEQVAAARPFGFPIAKCMRFDASASPCFSSSSYTPRLLVPQAAPVAQMHDSCELQVNKLHDSRFNLCSALCALLVEARWVGEGLANGGAGVCEMSHPSS